MDREDMIENLTGNDPAPADTSMESTSRENVSNNETEIDTSEAATPLGGEDAKSLLDSLTEGGETLAEPATPEAKPEDAPAAELKPAEPEAPKTLDEQEAEALANVKSERGQARIKEVFAARRELESKVAERDADIKEFREMVTSTGLAPQEFAQMLEVGRLIKSGDPQSLRAALGVIDGQREMLAKQLGIDLPGVDHLADFPDLKAAVDQGQMAPQFALETATLRRHQFAQQQAQQAQQARQQDTEQFQQSLAQAGQTAEAVFKQYESNVDHPAKMKALGEKFKQPGYMQRFVTTYQPQQWPAVLQDLYENMAAPVPAPPARPAPQPLRSRPSNVGTAAPNPAEPLTNRLMSHIDSLGI